MAKEQSQRKPATFTVTLFYTFFLGAMTYEILYQLEKEQYVLKAP